MRAETDREDTEQQEKMAVATSDRAQKTTTAYEAQDVILTARIGSGGGRIYR